MAKSYTNIAQSKELASILPLESADGFYEAQHNPLTDKWEYILFTGNKWASEEVVIPCWSLAALLDQLEDVICDEDGNEYELVIKKEDVQYDIYYLNICGEQDNIELDRFYDDLIDCCYSMVLKLKEKDLL